MLRLYYQIWGDVINTAEKNNGEWKIIILVLSIFQGLNLMTLSLVLDLIFNIKVTLFPIINIFPVQRFNDLLSGLVFHLPFMVFNYFMVYYKSKYKIIKKRYPSKNGKLLALYIFISVLSFLGFVLS